MQDSEGMARYLRGEIILTINGEITFEDCLRNVDTQYFGGLYRASPPDIFQYIQPVGLIPDHHTEEHT
jgi:hypothetical protein